MTIETTSSFNDTADQIIKNALLILTEYDPTDTLSTKDEAVGLEFLNLLVKHWEGLGIHIWATEHAIIWLPYNQGSYSLGDSASDDHWAINYEENTLTNPAAISATEIVVSSTSGITPGDIIGIVGSSSIFWTTSSGVHPDGRIELNDAVTEAIGAGAYVYTYTARPVKPLEILSVSRRSNTGTATSDIIIPFISFSDYQMLTNKFIQGTPLRCKYRPNTGSGKLTLWPIPIDMTQRLHIEYLRPLFDFTAGSDNPDVPQEWLLPLAYGLAVLLAPVYGHADKLAALEPIANSMLQRINNYDQEKTSLYLTPTKYKL